MTEPAAGNSEQIAYWNGRAGASWSDLHDRTDKMFVGLTPRLMEAARLRAGARVLDVGCGCGGTTLLAAGEVGSTGSVVGLDVSEPMLAQARRRGEGRENITWRLEDAAIASFDAPFEVVMSRFGIMFFTDPEAAFRNLAAALIPGGRVVFLCWQHPKANEWVTVPMQAARAFLPETEPPAPGTPGPFAFADDRRIAGILGAAGLEDIDIAPHTAPLIMGRDRDDVLHQLSMLGPLARAVAEVEPSIGQRALEAARDAVVAQAAPGTFALRSAFWLVSARRP